MGRTVIVGDVHGCPRELETMLTLVRFDAGDQLVLVGDILARGPDSNGVLDIVRRTGALVVRGNHEERILRSRAQHDRRNDERHALAWGAPSRPSDAQDADKPTKPPKPLGRIHADVAARLRPIDWALLEAMPLHVDLPEHGVRVVHAGVVPGVRFENQKRSTLLTIRTLGSRGEAIEKGGKVLWGTRYHGPPHVVFGHYARVEPQLHPWATGLDTGCVYGGTLTALVLEDGQHVPRDLAARRRLLVTVPAAREYYATGGS